MMLSSVLKNVLVLSLSDDQERREHINQHFSEIGIKDFEFFDAINYSDSRVANAYHNKLVKQFPNCFRCDQAVCTCENNILIPQQVANWLSFIEIWKSIAGKDGLFLICEDDVCFHHNAIPLLNNVLENISWENANCLLRLVASGLEPNKVLSANKGLHTVDKPVMSNAAYVISGSMASYLLQQFKTINHTSDVWLHQIIASHSNVQALTVEPLIGTDLSYNKDYAKFLSRIHPKGIDSKDKDRVAKHVKRVNSKIEYDTLYRQWFLLKSPTRKIFQIGFNKTGTTSLHHFFKDNGIKSIHWDERRLAKKIYDNYENQVDLLTGYEEFDAFLDMEIVTENDVRYVALDLFDKLHKAYPDAIFILNTRDMGSWIQSRLNHINKFNYPKTCMKFYGLSENELIKKWQQDYQVHINRVIDYFKSFPNASFIHLKIDEDKPTRLGEFLKNKGFSINFLSIPHTHKTSNKENRVEENKVNLFRDAAVAFERFDINVSHTLMAKAHEFRPHGPFIKMKLDQYKQQVTSQQDNSFVKFHTPEGYRKSPVKSLFNFYGRNKEDYFIFRDYINGKKLSHYYFEVGGLDGIWASNTKFLSETLNWKGILVEANPIAYSQLIKNRPLDNCFNCIISDHVGELDFSYYRDSPVSGVKGTLHKRIERLQGSDFITVALPTKTLDEIFQLAGVKEVGFFSLDVEGHELNVLRSFSFNIEVSIFLIEEGANDEEIKLLMISKGYTMHNKIGPNFVYLSADYIKENRVVV